MKFPQLPIGSRFTLHGEEYVKTGPLTATRQSDGQSRMIPRSATILTAAQEAAKPVDAADGKVEATALLEALDTCHRATLTAAASQDAEERAAGIEQAYRELLVRLGLA